MNIVKAYDFTNTDFAIFTSGANDDRKGVPTGTIAEAGAAFDLTTYVGCLQESIEHMQTMNPEIKIYLMTPLRGWYKEYNTVNVPSTDPTIVGMMKENKSLAMKKGADLYGKPCLDLYNLGGLNEQNKNHLLGDNSNIPYILHPTNFLYKQNSGIIVPFLNNY